MRHRLRRTGCSVEACYKTSTSARPCRIRYTVAWRPHVFASVFLIALTRKSVAKLLKVNSILRKSAFRHYRGRFTSYRLHIPTRVLYHSAYSTRDAASVSRLVSPPLRINTPPSLAFTSRLQSETDYKACINTVSYFIQLLDCAIRQQQLSYCQHANRRKNKLSYWLPQARNAAPTQTIPFQHTSPNTHLLRSPLRFS